MRVISGSFSALGLPYTDTVNIKIPRAVFVRVPIGQSVLPFVYDWLIEILYKQVSKIRPLVVR